MTKNGSKLLFAVPAVGEVFKTTSGTAKIMLIAKWGEAAKSLAAEASTRQAARKRKAAPLVVSASGASPRPTGLGRRRRLILGVRGRQQPIDCTAPCNPSALSAPLPRAHARVGVTWGADVMLDQPTDAGIARMEAAGLFDPWAAEAEFNDWAVRHIDARNEADCEEADDSGELNPDMDRWCSAAEEALGVQPSARAMSRLSAAVC